ncbi:GNAT family N-acetyltransferase [Brachybacterium sacelli]|uniref:Ribosomal protein S18 acetylase RimI-like enzyme n=1 Tax=Brachybacterium sacelli TaxID=173364 RepID=A0ABS4WZW7_9MICO|nr:GNAT family N-acetyltransferase [Brachybacterium sacelli]MBP2381748.1 ribosomal protein S18 acetylase RimI-like enzyme [Brachybacterium sacelli]
MTSVRVLDPGEWPLWRALRLRALEESPSAFGSTLAEVLARDAELYWRAGVSAPMVPFVAETDGIGAGMARLMFPAQPASTAELISLWVAPESRGRGVGHALVAAAVDHLAVHHPATRLRLAVVESNAPARALYTGSGFGVVGRNPEDDAELLMERRAATRTTDADPAPRSGREGARVRREGSRDR